MQCWYCNTSIDGKDEFCTCIHPSVGYPSPTRFKKYIVKGYLGSGQYGAVFKCFDPDLKRTVAVKKFDSKNITTTFSFQEMHAIAQINNQNVIQIYEAIPDKNIFVMEYAEGGTLQQEIDINRKYVIENFVPFALKICDGIRAAHKEGICHRDLKTENILLTKDKTPKVSDFGLAKFITSSSPGKTLAGTLLYTAPEVLEDNYDSTIDIYSLGVIFYHLWTGKFPFWASTAGGLVCKISKGDYIEPKEINEDIPDYINSLILRMICPRESRIGSLNLVISALERDSRLQIKNDTNFKEITIDDYQKELTAIYGHKNSHRLPTALLDHFSTNLAALIEGLRSKNASYRKERAEKYFPKTFAWLCAVYTSLGVYLSEILWCKYPDICLYCNGGVCTCESTLERPKADINNDLLDNINRNGFSESHESQSLNYYKEMFRRIYGNKNHDAGLDSVALHAFLEVNEARDAMLKIDTLDGFRQKNIMHLELADLTAWFFALLNLYDDSYNFEQELQKIFNGKCYYCGQKICNCPDVKLAPYIFW